MACNSIHGKALPAFKVFPTIETKPSVADVAKVGIPAGMAKALATGTAEKHVRASFFGLLGLLPYLLAARRTKGELAFSAPR